MATKFLQTSYKTKEETPQKLTVSSTGATLSTAIPIQLDVIRFSSNTDFWMTFGSSTIAASSTAGGGSIFMPSLATEYKNISKASYVSVIADGSSGFVCISAETQ